MIDIRLLIAGILLLLVALANIMVEFGFGGWSVFKDSLWSRNTSISTPAPIVESSPVISPDLTNNPEIKEAQTQPTQSVHQAPLLPELMAQFTGYTLCSMHITLRDTSHEDAPSKLYTNLIDASGDWMEREEKTPIEDPECMDDSCEKKFTKTELDVPCAKVPKSFQFILNGNNGNLSKISVSLETADSNGSKNLTELKVYGPSMLIERDSDKTRWAYLARFEDLR